MWSKLDDNVLHHDKTETAARRLGRRRGLVIALGTVTFGLVYCNWKLTDGFIHRDALDRYGVDLKLRSLMVDVGFWHAEADGYRIHDFHEFNPSADAVKAKRLRDRLRKQSRAGFHADSTRNPNGFPRAATSRADPYPYRSHYIPNPFAREGATTYPRPTQGGDPRPGAARGPLAGPLRSHTDLQHARGVSPEGRSGDAMRINHVDDQVPRLSDVRERLLALDRRALVEGSAMITDLALPILDLTHRRAARDLDLRVGWSVWYRDDVRLADGASRVVPAVFQGYDRGHRRCRITRGRTDDGRVRPTWVALDDVFARHWADGVEDDRPRLAWAPAAPEPIEAGPIPFVVVLAAAGALALLVATVWRFW